MRFWAGMAAGLTAGLALMAAPAMAAEAAGARAAAHVEPLKPGKSAGVRAAQQQVRAGVALVGAGAIIAVVVVAAGSGGGSGGSQPNAQFAPVTTSP